MDILIWLQKSAVVACSWSLLRHRELRLQILWYLLLFIVRVLLSVVLIWFQKLGQSVPTEIICSLSSFDILLRWKEGECERVKKLLHREPGRTLVDLLLQCHILPQFLRNGGSLRLDPFPNVLSWWMVLFCSSWQAFLLPGNAGWK